jgi:hypothetical protein
MPTDQDFQAELDRTLQSARARGLRDVVVRAGDLHRRVGGYPAKDGNHRMPICCRVMRANMKARDTILRMPPKRDGPNVEIRYWL